MKRIQIDDFDKLSNELLNIDNLIKNDIKALKIFDEYKIGVGNATSSFYVNSDVKKLSKQLIYYFYKTYKGFKFIEFYDKVFIDILKALIKNKDEFLKFLDLIELDAREFFELCIHIAPSCFTSNLIKFIKTNYL